MEYLFIPNEEATDELVSLVTSKFAFINTVKSIITEIKDSFENIEAYPKLSLNINSKYYTGEVTVLNLSWYAPYKQYGDIVLTGFIYIFFIWRFFVHLPNIVGGTGGAIESSINIGNFVERSKK